MPTLVFYTVSNTIPFMVWFAIAILFFLIALTRKTLVMMMLSSVAWFSFAFGIFTVYTSSSLANGLAMFSAFMGTAMIILTFYESTKTLRELEEERKRKIAEEII